MKFLKASARKFFSLFLLTLLVAGCTRVNDTNFNLGGNGSGYGRSCNGKNCQAQIVSGGNLTIVLDPSTAKDAVITKAARFGSATVAPGPNSTPWAVIYTPNASFVGKDEFAYDLEGGGLATSINYVVEVKADPNNPPSGNGGLSYQAFIAPLMQSAKCTTCHTSNPTMSTSSPFYLDVFEQQGWNTLTRWKMVQSQMAQMIADPQSSASHTLSTPLFSQVDVDNIGQWISLGMPEQ